MDTYQIKTGLQNMDISAIHNFLSLESYWAANISLETIEIALQNSFCVGVFDQQKQIGFARLITDYSTFGYLADVYILKDYRNKGLSKVLMKFIMDTEWTKGLRRMLLATLDAHSLYKQFTFDSPKHPEWIMEINRKDIYKKHQ